MLKRYNFIINSENRLSGTRSNATFNINWSSLMDEGEYLLTFTFTGTTQLLVGNYNALVRMNGLSFNNFEITNTANGATSSNILGCLRFNGSLGFNQIGYLASSFTDNPPIHLLNRPNINQFNITINNTINNNSWVDDSVAGAGTATLSGTTLTIVTQTAGTLIIGSPVVISSTTYTITNYVTGNGGTGTYTVDTSGTISTATAFTVAARQPLGPYILELCFEKISN